MPAYLLVLKLQDLLCAKTSARQAAGMDTRTEEQAYLVVRLAIVASDTRDLGLRSESQDIREQLLQIAMQLDRIIDRLTKRKTSH